MINNDYSQISFGKKYCYIPKCKAICCASAPIPKATLKDMQNRLVRRIIINYKAPQNNRYCEDAVVPITTLKAFKYMGTGNMGQNSWKVDLRTPNNYCPFLRKDYQCNIYENRPPICRHFGSEDGRECLEQVSLSKLIMLKTKDIIKKAFKIFV